MKTGESPPYYSNGRLVDFEGWARRTSRRSWRHLFLRPMKVYQRNT